MQDTREAIVAWAKYLEQHKTGDVYTEGPNRMSGVGHRGKLPLSADCSAFVTVCYNWAGADDPNGFNYDGEGYTGTLVARGLQVSKADVQPGDVVIYGGGPGVHAALVIEAGTDPLTISMGQQGDPSKVYVSHGDPSLDHVVRFFRYHTGAAKAYYPEGITPQDKTKTQTESKVVPMKFTTESVASIVRQLAAYAGIATQVANSGHLPTNVRTAIIAASGALLSIEHYAAKPKA